MPPEYPDNPSRGNWTFQNWYMDRGFHCRVKFTDTDGGPVRHWLAHLPITQAEFHPNHYRAESVQILGDPAIAGRFRELEMILGYETTATHRALARAFRSDNLRKLTLGKTIGHTHEVLASDVLEELLSQPPFQLSAA